MTTLTLVRHGQTDWNLAQRIQGSTDIPLNETGRQQALETGKRLRGRGIDTIATSPLIRALETARIIAEVLGLGEPAIVPGIVERAYGEAEGMDATALADRFPGMKGVPGLERRSEVRTRVLPALEAVALANLGAHVVVVAHGGVISSVVRYLSDQALPEPSYRMPNGSDHRFGYADGLLRLTEFNGESVDFPPRPVVPTGSPSSAPS